MLGELIPVGGGDSIPLLQEKLTVGRRSSCDIVFGFPNVSSRHCELELINGYWRVTDLGSRNGVKVNGERCDSKWLHPGDEIGIAKHFYTISYEALGSAPEEEDDPFELGLLEKAGLQRDQERRRGKMPPPARKPQEINFSKDEDDAMQWLSDD